jgi:tRNA 5-methylaminomethyl-2-thiouridine biosynthesis bifunctional protein
MNISYLPNSNHPTKINFANITFTESKEPINEDFKDVYFSDEGGFYESLYVFFKGNNLHNRLIETKNNGVNEFNIGETGFGTGLNLLALMFILDKIQECINNNSELNILDMSIDKQILSNIKDKTSLFPHINFITFEKFPVALEDLKKTHIKFKELANYSEKLSSKYKDLKPGINKIEITPNITLFLIIDDINNALNNIMLSNTIDAWYLDGFAPTQNEAMWSETTSKQLAAISKDKTTIATFTVAGFVRRNIQNAGFSITKKKGFGRKREMLTAIFDQTN